MAWTMEGYYRQLDQLHSAIEHAQRAQHTERVKELVVQLRELRRNNPLKNSPEP